MSDNKSTEIAPIVIGAVAFIGIAVFAFGAYKAIEATPATWRTCQPSGRGSTCLRDVSELSQIKTLENGCITDGSNVICGSYWQERGKW